MKPTPSHAADLPAGRCDSASITGLLPRKQTGTGSYPWAQKARWSGRRPAAETDFSSGSLHEQSPTTLLISHPGRAIHLSPKESSPSSQNLLLPPAQPTELKPCVVNMASLLRGIGRHQSHFRENTSPGAIYNTHNLTGVAAPLHI